MGATLSTPSITYQFEAGQYHCIVPIPPKITLELVNMYEGYCAVDGKFQTGILSTVPHCWRTRFYGTKKIKAIMDIRQPYPFQLLETFYLELLSQDQVKSRHELHFQSVGGEGFDSKIRWHATWMNDGSWDDTIDKVRFIVDVSE